MSDNKEKLEKLFQISKEKAENSGFTVMDFKAINYGIQFQVSKSSWHGILRIYANKKGQVKYDYSQIKDERIKDELFNLIEGTIGDEKPNNEKLKTQPSISEPFIPLIGTDESGKGDYFGPLVTAGVYVHEKNKVLLEKIGVRDSKKLKDDKITELAKEIRRICFDQYAIIEISPETYNNLYDNFKKEGKNLNTLLAWGHAKAIEEILGKVDCDNALSDKFADERFILSKLQEKGKQIKLRQEHKAESNIAVAAASILARARFVDKMNKLSQEYKIELAKGASNLVIEQARKIVQLQGIEALRKIAKLHFKTTNEVINSPQ